MIGSKAQAIVDAIGQGQWSVTAWDDNHRRIYTFKAKDDNEAARMGLDAFDEEVGVLDEGLPEPARASLGDHLRRLD